MNQKISLYKILFLSLLLTGCTNSIYFYETEKISLTVEARPDSSQPVQGNLGIKQRVAMIVPRKSNNEDGDGEALSTISSFDFRIIDTPKKFNPILVRTAFVTGDAADRLYDNKIDPSKSKAADVAKTLSFYKAVEEINIEEEMTGKILEYLTDNSENIDANKLNNLIIKARASDPNIMTFSVESSIKNANTKKALKDLLSDRADVAIYPLYKAIPIN
ncbi:hypothetical protein SAMN05216326_13153 [Nitrosomonas marina]|uniref:Lipoprotein n=1 Tax=Nitrosomonas marina TaxID=917 RepID=A0A1I0EZ19_9PROT|nr:hypothetical protein [Nitrosomonas marina]SET50738.1 hypothetical protein SAMN05216326_13153 [Nitrosomonas marina]